MGHQLVALLRGGIEADRIIVFVIRRTRYLLVGSINATGTGINQVFHFVITAGFQDVIETDQINLDVAVGIGDAITDSSLGGQIDNYLRMIGVEQ